MNSTHIISQDVFDKIRSRFTNLEMGDEQGEVTTDPKSARFFDFDFVVESQNLGRVSISINETGSLKIFYSQNILEDTDDFVHQLWYDFLREMRMFAKRRLLRFDTRDITKSNLNKDDFQYLATNGPKDNNMSESIKFEGSKKTSYRVLEKTKLIAKHKESIENEAHGARSRKGNIKALYIENADGERFKYPFIHISGAKAMQRHVANGGRPYDEKGNAIIKMSEDIMKLTAFKRHVGKPDALNQRVNEITGKTDSKLESLRRTLEGLCNQGYYEKWNESFVPNNADSDSLDQATLEDYKSTFTVSSFREDLAEYFPLIHSIMREAGTIDLDQFVEEAREESCNECGMMESDCECDDRPNEGVFAEFENWANRVSEGKLEPDTIMNLKDLLEKGLTLDVDGQSAIEALQGIGIHSEELEVELSRLADPEQGGDPQSDPRDTILSWLAKDDPESAEHLGYTGQASSQEEEMVNPSEASPAPSVRDIAEMVYSMYDAETGKFPKGKTGVAIHVGKEMGDEAGKLAERLCDHLQPDNNSQETAEEYGPAATAALQQGESPISVSFADLNDKSNQRFADMNKKENLELESIMKLAGVPAVSEEVEDRTCYKVARFLFDKGMRYNPQNEKQIINKMDDAMIAMDMPAKTIQYLLRHDEDFIADTLGELRNMESAVDELSTGSPAPVTMDDPMDEGTLDAIKKVGHKAKEIGKKVLDKIAPGDEELLQRLEKETGGKRPNMYNKSTNEEFDVILKLAGMKN